jgi:glycosyltransferase involved in cell wall biosynthesis
MSNPTSISFFLPDLNGGGAERAMLHLAQGLAKHGLKVDLVLAQAQGEYLKTVPPEVRLINLNARRPIMLFKTIALHNYLKSEQPAILFSALDILSSAIWANLLSGSPTKVVMCVQTYLSQQFRDKPQLVLGRLRAYLVHQFYPWATKIVAASKGTAEDVSRLTNIPLQEIEVIYNPVVMPELFEKAKEPVDHPWFQAGEPPVILGVGRLVRQKDFVTLIRAFAIVRERIPCRLMILGTVSQQEPQTKIQLESLIQELGLEREIALPGFVENPYSYMAKAAVFALSSIYEGFGNVVAEALATGTSVVSTDCKSGPAEILEYGKYGCLVSVGNVEALADAMETTLKNPFNSEQLRERSQKFSIKNVVNQYLELIRILSPQL